MEDEYLLPKFLTTRAVRPPRSAVPMGVGYVMMPKHRGLGDYIGGIADSIGALADRDGDGPDLETNRAKELTVLRIERFRGIQPPGSQLVYTDQIFIKLFLRIAHHGKHQLWNL